MTGDVFRADRTSAPSTTGTLPKFHTRPENPPTKILHPNT